MKEGLSRSAPSRCFPLLIDLGYLAAGITLSPWLLYKFASDRRCRTGLPERLGFHAPRDPARPALWFHCVSVGEVLTGQSVVDAFGGRHPDWEVVVSTTTTTGQEVARKRFPARRVVYYPIDWGGAGARAMDRLRPTAIAMLELELWPNYFLHAARRGIPIFILNGRITEKSVRRFGLIRPIVRAALKSVAVVCAQGEEHAERFRRLGVPADRVTVTGNLKFDGAPSPAAAPHDDPTIRRLGIRPQDLVWIGGSTHDPEEKLILNAQAALRARHPRLRLVLVPRHPERAEAVAKEVAAHGLRCYKSSSLATGAAPPANLQDAVIVVDTVGELRKLYGIATLAFVGGSLIRHGGQNLIEPAALGCPVLFGPHVENFREIADALLAAGAAVQVPDAAALETAAGDLMAHPDRLAAMAQAGRRTVDAGRGATDRTLDVLERCLLHPES
jgi:3-deoxy-D-manno-octulosonic-acid transferase